MTGACHCAQGGYIYPQNGGFAYLSWDASLADLANTSEHRTEFDQAKENR